MTLVAERPSAPTRAERRQARRRPASWQGPYVRYDIVKEFVIALVVVTMLTVALAAVLSSPDDRALTVSNWAQADPVDFATTAISELDGSSGTAQYGPPYTHVPGAGQKIGPIGLQSFAGVRTPVDTANDFVLSPLHTVAGYQPALTAALTQYQSASADQQGKWTSAYEDAVKKATFGPTGLVVPPGGYGPVGTLISAETTMARTGALDGYLLSSKQFYGTDYTKPLLFLADGSYLAAKAQSEHLHGNQWGMMNETGRYPGQAWLWLYTMWYQIPPFSTSGNADALIWGIMLVLTLALICVPFIPGLRSLPRRLGVYRLIWREHYRRVEAR
ncbi:MAG TPA: hypothetical protein VFA11_01770 [Acidimicrobiales bacterium]|nr:hypothetical protein [Acidimicrobiales bacterium]